MKYIENIFSNSLTMYPETNEDIVFLEKTYPPFKNCAIVLYYLRCIICGKLYLPQIGHNC